MESVNQHLFLLIHASQHPGPVAFACAVFFANWLVWLVPALIFIGWFRGNEKARKTAMLVSFALVLGIFASYFLGHAFSYPRPFVIGLGQNYIPHEADASFPSSHLTLWWSAVICYTLCYPYKKLGYVLILLGLPIAWARVYLGVHYPMDMLGSAMVGLICASFAWGGARFYLSRCYHCASYIERKLLGWL